MSNQYQTTTSSEKGQRLAREKFHTRNRNRWPTLEEVLYRKTAPPVCLYNFYLFMRDRERAEEYLDFWLDISEHEVLFKHYVKDLKNAGGDVDVEFPAYALTKSSALAIEKDIHKRYSDTSLQGSARRELNASPFGSSDSGSNPPSRAGSPSAVGRHYAINVPGENKFPRNRDSVRSNTTGNLSFIGRQIAREDIRASAERIFYRYVSSGSQKEIDLPEAIRERIGNAIEKGHDDPNVFAEAKKEVLELLRADPFPRFLNARAYGNMTVLHTMLRLVLGLLLLFVGFSIELSFIFLDKQRLLRLWGFIPIYLGVSNIYANQKGLSPFFVLLKTSETTFLQFQKVQERFIYKLQVRRASEVFIIGLLISVLITAIFVAVPGHRLMKP